MNGGRTKGQVLALCSLALSWMSAGFCQDAQDHLELGRSIFQEGVGRDGRKLLSSNRNRYGAGIPVVCADCHGEDAGGGGESFIVAPSVRWADLSKRYRAGRAGGEQAPYDRASFAQALRAGVDASGHQLDPMMPSLGIADDEVDALVAYLGALSTDARGRKVQQKAAALLPAPGVSAFSDRLRDSISSCNVAQQGGGRYAALDIIEYDSVEEVPALLEAALASGRKLTLVAPFIVGWESEYQRIISNQPVSTVLPITHDRPPSGARWYFQLPTSFDLTARLLRSAYDRGVRKLIIHYDEGHRLSSKLLDFSLGFARRLGIEVISETAATDLVPSAQPVLARLWLHDVDPDRALKQDKTSLHLALAVFLSGAVPRADLSGGEEAAASRFTVAYPYPPSSTGMWRPPAAVWAEASCHFLAQLDLREPLDAQVSQMRLTTQEYPELTSITEAEQRADRAYLLDEIP